MAYVEPQMTEEEVQAAMERILGVDTETTPTPPPVEPEPTPEPEPIEPPAAYLELPDGRRITTEEAQRWAAFEPTLQDPRFLRAYQEAFNEPETPSQPAPTTAPTQTDLPPELADELAVSPLARAMWERIQSQQRIIDEFGQRVTHVDEVLNLTEQRNAMSLINEARRNFQNEKNLSDADLDRVYAAALRMYDLDRLVSMPVHPRDGEAETPHPVKRIEEVFDYAYQSFPEFRERDFEKRMEESRADAERKAKMSALSTSGSSAPPQTPTPAPSNPAERRALLAQEIAAIQAGTSIQPE